MQGKKANQSSLVPNGEQDGKNPETTGLSSIRPGEPVVQMKGITIRFGEVVANSDVNFELRKGEIHALLGENGAGKTTLTSILYGLYQPQAGEIYVRGKKTTIKSPNDSMELSIAMVHQHFLLTLPHSVTENIIVGLKSQGFFLNLASAEKKIQQLSEKYGLKIDPKAVVGDMAVGEQQRVEIVKALYRDAEILILDEPTSMLTPQEEKALFAMLESMVRQGLSIIFITHKLHEVMEVSNRVTVLRGGKVVGTVNTSETNETELAKMMVGRPVIEDIQLKSTAQNDIVLQLKNISALNNSNILFLKDLSLELRKGQILGIAGVDGNGQAELAEVIAGLRKVQSGEIMMDGRSTTKLSPRKIREWGLAYVPQDRLNTGLVLEYSISENLVLDRWYTAGYSGKVFLKQEEMKKFAEKVVVDFEVKTPGINVPISSMSGGNLQKVLMARELARNPKVLVVHNPTRGLDIGAAEYIHKQLVKQRENGVGVLMLSLDLDEILTVCDRIAVIYEGKIMGVVDREDADVDRIGLLMGGKSVALEGTK
ncbi:ABC transporter ATP-binding protein [Nitrososphaera sp.]|uniref:ABC transporter ATP-binding protein n=1 Tax=Nitrososphaera sp. TaxID=1971748 RepID=UPI002ED9A603